MEKEKYLTEMQPLLSERVVKSTDNIDIVVKFSRYGNEHLYSDTLGRAKGVLLKKDLKNLKTALEHSEFVKSVAVTEQRKDGVTKFYYFKDNALDLYYNVGERAFKGKKGKIRYFRFLYSATRNLKSGE